MFRVSHGEAQSGRFFPLARQRLLQGSAPRLARFGSVPARDMGPGSETWEKGGFALAPTKSLPVDLMVVQSKVPGCPIVIRPKLLAGPEQHGVDREIGRGRAIAIAPHDADVVVLFSAAFLQRELRREVVEGLAGEHDGVERRGRLPGAVLIVRERVYRHIAMQMGIAA